MGTLVGNKGLEPLHLSIHDPKSCASANSANSPGGTLTGGITTTHILRLLCPNSLGLLEYS